MRTTISTINKFINSALCFLSLFPNTNPNHFCVARGAYVCDGMRITREFQIFVILVKVKTILSLYIKAPTALQPRQRILGYIERSNPEQIGQKVQFGNKNTCYKQILLCKLLGRGRLAKFYKPPFSTLKQRPQSLVFTIIFHNIRGLCTCILQAFERLGK